MKLFWVYLKTNLQNVMTYRGDTIIWALSAAIAPLISLAVWSAVSLANSNLPFSKNDLVVYFLLAYLVDVMTSCWAGYFLIEQIKNGEFRGYLLKPVSPLFSYAANNIGEKIIKLMVTLISLTVLNLLFFPSGIPLEITLIKSTLFVISIVLAGALFFMLDMAISMTALWIYNAEFLRWGFYFGKWFFSGIIIPIYFLPPVFYNLSLYLPFRYIISFPVEVMMGKVLGADLIFGFSMQIFWVLTGVFLYKIIYKFGSKGYEGYGI